MDPKKPEGWTVRGVAGAAARVVAVLCCLFGPLAIVAVVYLAVSSWPAGFGSDEWAWAAVAVTPGLATTLCGLYVLSRPRER